MKFKRLKLKIFISFAADYKNAQVAELVDALDSKSINTVNPSLIPQLQSTLFYYTLPPKPFILVGLKKLITFKTS